MTILMAAMGDQAGRMPWHWWLALLAAAVLGWIFIQGWLHRRNAKRAITMQSKVSSHHGEHGSTPAARGKREGVPPQPPQCSRMWLRSCLSPVRRHAGFGNSSEEHTSELRSLMRTSYAVF